MSTFRVGQKVVCINDFQWGIVGTSTTTTTTSGWWLWKKTVTTRSPNKTAPGPKKDEIVTIVALDGEGWLMLSGYEQYGGYYQPTCFRPLNNIEEALERIEEEAKTGRINEPIQP